MGLYFRKSLKFGPFRINFSKHGVGYSVGPKGLKLGVDSLGRRYISGGKGGLYFRKYTNEKIINNSQYQHSIFSKHFIGITLLLFTIAYFFNFTVILLLIAAYIIFKIYNLYIKNKTNKLTIKLLSSYDNYDNFVSIYNSIPPKNRYKALLENYQSIIYNTLIDNKINPEEEKILNFIKSKINFNNLEDINVAIANDIVRDVFSDKILTNDEEKFLNKLVEILDLHRLKQEIKSLIEQYKNFKNSGNIQYHFVDELNMEVAFCEEGKFFKQLKSKTKLFKKGLVFITNKYIAIKDKNLYKIPLNKIDSIQQLDNDLILVEIKNRVTPIIISVNNPFLFLSKIYMILNKSIS